LSAFVSNPKEKSAKRQVFQEDERGFSCVLTEHSEESKSRLWTWGKTGDANQRTKGAAQGQERRGNGLAKAAGLSWMNQDLGWVPTGLWMCGVSRRE
jgi:hypothetical protein